jgi:hypothetical protein
MMTLFSLTLMVSHDLCWDVSLKSTATMEDDPMRSQYGQNHSATVSVVVRCGESRSVSTCCLFDH